LQYLVIWCYILQQTCACTRKHTFACTNTQTHTKGVLVSQSAHQPGSFCLPWPSLINALN
jgi:hypothetical protein